MIFKIPGEITQYNGLDHVNMVQTWKPERVNQLPASIKADGTHLIRRQFRPDWKIRHYNIVIMPKVYNSPECLFRNSRPLRKSRKNNTTEKNKQPVQKQYQVLIMYK